MATDLSVDGTDLGTYNFVMEPVTGLAVAGVRDWDELVFPDKPGTEIENLRRPGRLVSINGSLRGASINGARTNIEELSDFVESVEDFRTLTLGSLSSTEMRARLKRFDAFPIGPVFATDRWRIEMDWLMSPPWWLSSTETTVSSITTTPKDLAAGTAPIWYGLRYRVQGSATDPTITIKDNAGVTVAAQGWTITLSGSEYLCVDLWRRNAYLNATGNWNEGTEVSELWDRSVGPAGYRWFHLIREWWDYATSDWATVALNSGGGTGEIIYPRAWRRLGPS